MGGQLPAETVQASPLMLQMPAEAPSVVEAVHLQAPQSTGQLFAATVQASPLMPQMPAEALSVRSEVQLQGPQVCGQPLVTQESPLMLQMPAVLLSVRSGVQLQVPQVCGQPLVTQESPLMLQMPAVLLSVRSGVQLQGPQACGQALVAQEAPLMLQMPAVSLSVVEVVQLQVPQSRGQLFAATVQDRDDGPVQGVPPHAAGSTWTFDCVPALDASPVDAVQAQVLQDPPHQQSRGSLPVQDWDAGPTQAAPPHAGDGFVQARVCVPGKPQALAEHALHADQPPSTRAFAVHERNDGPEQALPPHPGAGLVQVRVCLPVPQLAEQLLHADQPPSRAEAPVQARVSLVPRVPSSFRHSWPPCSGDGLSQLRVCVPLPPQAVAEQAPHADQPPSTAMDLRHLSEFAPPCRPSQRHRYALEVSAIAASLAVPAEQPLRTLSSHAPSTGMNLKHFSESAPPCRPSQRHRWAFELSGTAPSLAVPAAQPLRAFSSHTPSTGMNLWHFSESAPPCRPSQRQR